MGGNLIIDRGIQVFSRPKLLPKASGWWVKGRKKRQHIINTGNKFPISKNASFGRKAPICSHE